MLGPMNTVTEHTPPEVVREPSSRTVAGVFASTPFHWVGDGFRVATYFPRPRLPAERVSPFLLMDYGPPRAVAPQATGRRGVGWHPHRGFETVTLAWAGSVAHRDSAGHRGVIGPGDVQWMTAASGILHEEYLESGFSQRGGTIHMMQLWVNLPAAKKMGPPGYQPITAAEIPAVPIEGGGAVRVIAGEHRGARGPARTQSPVTMLDVNLPAGGRLRAELPAGYNALAVVTSGRVTVGAAKAAAGELVLFENDGAQVVVDAVEETHLVVLAGEPIDEPIVQYGPFVMNTREEIVRAVDDFESGRFGPIPGV